MSTSRLAGTPVAGAGSTSGAVTATVVSQNPSAPGYAPAADNVAIHVEGVLIGYDSTGSLAVSMRVTRAFSRIAGVLTALGAATVNAIAPQGDATLTASSGTLDVSGASIRLRATGVAAHDIAWTGFLYMWTTDY